MTIEIEDRTQGCDEHRADRLLQAIKALPEDDRNNVIRDLYLRFLDSVRLLDEAKQLTESYQRALAVLTKRSGGQITISDAELLEVEGAFDSARETSPPGFLFSLQPSPVGLKPQ
jgi:hypothetical protein